MTIFLKKSLPQYSTLKTEHEVNISLWKQNMYIDLSPNLNQ